MSTNNMIVVTGGAGFIGSMLVKRLNELGESKIVIVDNLGTTDKWRNIEGLDFDDYVHKNDFPGKLATGKFDKAVTAVFHLGAQSSTTETDVDYLMRNNYEYSRTLCAWALERGARFIYASSAATYGDGACGYSDEHSRLAGLHPLNAYGYSKQLFDRWAHKNGLLDRIVGLKYFNVFGPNEGHKGAMRSMVHKALEQIARDGRVRLFKSHRPDFADGEQRRDFIYVKDAVDATLHFFERPDANGIFNIGTGSPRTWNALATAVFQALGRKPDIEYIDMPPELRGRYQYSTQADVSKLRKAGYEKDPLSLENAVRDTIAFLQ